MLLFHEEDGMGRRGYLAEFRQRVLELIATGRQVADVARDLGISDQIVYDWRHQDRPDRASSPASLQPNAQDWRRRGVRFGIWIMSGPFTAPRLRYYARRSRAPSPRSNRHAWITAAVIRQLHAASRYIQRPTHPLRPDAGAGHRHRSIGRGDAHAPCWGCKGFPAGNASVMSPASPR